MADSKWIKRAVDEFEVPLLRYAMSLLGDLDRARDVVQDTFLRLCRQPRHDVQNHLAPWLFRVCRNRAVDSLRRKGRMQQVTDSEFDRIRADCPDPQEALEREEQLSRVEQMMAGLTENQREVLRLKFQGGLSYRQISEVTGLSVTNVGFLIHTGIKTLRERSETRSRQQESIRRVK